MTLEKLKELLDTTRLPVAYRQWAVGQVPKLPYILYYAKSDNNFLADNEVYVPGDEIVIELYSNMRNVLEERKIEKILNDHKIPFSWYESYLDSERMNLKAYEITIKGEI